MREYNQWESYKEHRRVKVDTPRKYMIIFQNIFKKLLFGVVFVGFYVWLNSFFIRVTWKVYLPSKFPEMGRIFEVFKILPIEIGEK